MASALNSDRMSSEHVRTRDRNRPETGL